MGFIAKDITELIGKTPLVKLNRINNGLQAKIVAKLEFLNPGFSVKDRLGLALIEDAEKKGLLKKGFLIIESTSGNTGIALALISAIKGYRLILVMPDSVNKEKICLLKTLGAEVELTPKESGMQASVERAKELKRVHKDAFLPLQFENPVNPKIHELTTAVEIWDDTEGKIDILVSAIGTGGTITGVARSLKRKNKNISIIGVEPKTSAVISGAKPGAHKIQGIGAGFIPKVLNKDIIDEVVQVSDEQAFIAARDLIAKEGILGGISSGAAVSAALTVAEREENKNKLIVVILPDACERYLSTDLFDREVS